MGSIERRLEALEAHLSSGPDLARQQAYRAFIERLTGDELSWLADPGEEAQSLVPCPHVEMLECECRSDERAQRGFEAHPELREEYLRRRQSLVERAEEIMARPKVRVK